MAALPQGPVVETFTAADVMVAAGPLLERYGGYLDIERRITPSGVESDVSLRVRISMQIAGRIVVARGREVAPVVSAEGTRTASEAEARGRWWRRLMDGGSARAAGRG